MTASNRASRTVRGFARAGIAASLALPILAFFVLLTTTAERAQAMKIQSVKSPGGIEAWLVEDHTVPLMAMKFAFEGGSSQDPAGKEGLANFITGMMDEGAGELNSSEFQERMEEIAMRMSFEDTKDYLYGSFETLTVNRDKAVELLRLAVTKPRFEAEAVDRVRQQFLAALAYADRNPEKRVSREWYATAFAGHPYARPSDGTPQTVSTITGADLEDYRRRVFAKNNMKISVVGDIDAATLGKLLDTVFGGLADKASLQPVPQTQPIAGGKQNIVEMKVPQSVAMFGLGAMKRKDPDFIPAFVLNQILGGGGFASRLMEEVREKRGLAYSVYSYLQPFKHTSILAGGVATKNEAIGQSLDVIRGELKRMADNGPTETELANAKSYLVGSYALRFDTDSKIAGQLLGIQIEDLGIDYVDTRNAQIEAVTMTDIKRVAARLLKSDDLIVTIIGQPANMAKRG